MLVNIRDTTVESGGALHWGADVGQQRHQDGLAGRPAHCSRPGRRPGTGGTGGGGGGGGGGGS